MYCTACGTRNPEKSNYCKKCGQAMERLAAQPISEEEFDRELPLDEQVTALLERAYGRRKSGDVNGAVELCESALRIVPDSTSAHSLLGQLYEERGDHPAAIKEYERVLQINPGSIADRVKLDELRSGEGPEGASRPAPRIVLADRASKREDRTAFVLSLTIGGIILVIAGLAQLHRTNSQPPEGGAGHLQSHAATSETTTPGSAAAPSAGTSSQVAPQGSTPAQGSPAANTPANGTIAAAAPPAPSSGTQPAGAPAAQASPQVVYVPARPRVVYLPGPSGRTTHDGSGLPSMGTAARRSTDSDGSSDRVVLEGEGQRINVDVKPERAAPAAAKPEPMVTSIKVHNGDGDSGSASIATAPDSRAQSRLTIASSLNEQGKYREAIRAYQEALPSAGDRTAYVYQQLAICYRQDKDRSNARANYTRALDEYNKLIQAGRQVELARRGVKVCEYGIKLCDSE